MSTLVIEGSQWGDEGKGKITDYFAQEADVVFKFDTYPSADFIYNKNDLSIQKTIRLPNPAHFGPEQEKKLPHFLAHEIGHFYGLGDRYQEGVEGSSPLYSTTEGTDGTALMAIAKKPDVTPDDVDGFINLMDVTQAFAARRFNKRAEKGWVSFVSASRLYARGKELNRQAFFDGHTIYYYNKDGSIKDRKQGKTKDEYNPLAETQAKQGPFRSVQRISSTSTSIDTFFDYTKLASLGRFSATSRIANLTMLTLEGKKSGPQTWDLQFDYQRGFNGYPTKKQRRFTVQVGPETCHIQAISYGDALQNIQAELNPTTGQFSFKGQAKDSAQSTPFKLQATGTEQDSQFVYTQGQKAYHIRWKDDSIYLGEDAENMDEQIFFVTDNMGWVRKVLEDEFHYCQYFHALGK